MTLTEKFQIVAAVVAGLAVVGFLVPGRDAVAASARHAASLAVLVAAWILLGASLIERDDASRGWDQIASFPRIGIALAALAVTVAACVILVRLIVARPVIWFVLLAVTLPIRIPVTVGSQSANLLVPLYAVVGLGLIAWIVGRRSGRFTTSTPRSLWIDVTTALFTAMTLVSVWWSGDVQEATIKIVCFYIPFVVLLRLVASLWPHADRPLRALLTVTLSMASAVAVLALYQFTTDTIWWNDTLQVANNYNRFFRANGIFFDPNMLGRYLALAMVAGVAVLLVTRTSGRAWLVSAACAVMAAGLVVTFSRSSAIMLTAALFVLAIRAFGVKRTLLVTLAALLLIGGPAMALKENVREKFTSWDELIATSEGRHRLATGGVDLWKTAPIQGVGLGAFSERYAETFPERDRKRTRVFISHTAPVTVLAELGAVGLGLFVLMGLGAIVALVKASRPRDTDGLVAWTILAILIGIFLHSLLYSALFEDPYVWTLLGIGAALLAVRRRDTPPAVPADSPMP